MDAGRIALASVGGVSALLGLAVLTRPAPGDAARYARRIAGTMLLAFGLAAIVLTVLLTRAQSLELVP
ncbi:hypothetical protein [Novosphingobium sp.]|uniref:hypothetical protein n=1 Tax=Novosphingobium sp. TaxID=1874826 RepID=UPI0022C0AF0E|nr:hypothetical protein [Novosphingobium sp.]MCZ8019208.1 hypothetical protein [Novosphingobium sp.]MCZ8035016.1 hypothetical protein [Novosphingobium sp.]MCZ8052584.1 hypothetical protein [Novosphingobium sp.]MCZ8058683.1 hypothetical protein [Novosphingobium sp.]MCZ8233080.1 hypothetical protein [Novosphingobium sp.]